MIDEDKNLEIVKHNARRFSTDGVATILRRGPRRGAPSVLRMSKADYQSRKKKPEVVKAAMELDMEEVLLISMKRPGSALDIEQDLEHWVNYSRSNNVDSLKNANSLS